MNMCIHRDKARGCGDGEGVCGGSLVLRMIQRGRVEVVEPGCVNTVEL